MFAYLKIAGPQVSPMLVRKCCWAELPYYYLNAMESRYSNSRRAIGRY